MTCSWPSFFAAATRASKPPRAVALVAVEAQAPEDEDEVAVVGAEPHALSVSAAAVRQPARPTARTREGVTGAPEGCGGEPQLVRTSRPTVRPTAMSGR